MDKKYILVYDEEYEKKINEEILAMFTGMYLAKIPYKDIEISNLAEDEILIFYLNEQQIYEILPKFVNKELRVSFLPHEKSGNLLIDFGISKNLEEAIYDIKFGENKKINVLYCNEIPVFNSVKIGDMFIANQQKEKETIWSKIKLIKEKLKILHNTPHKAYLFSSNDNKIIDTSALGISIVTSPNNSIVSKKIVFDEASDGFHTIISSPKSILDMLKFFIQSFFSKKKIKKIPEFIGYIKCNNLKISGRSPIDFILDGKALSAREIDLKILEEKINLIPGRNFKTDYNKILSKTSQKIKDLPTGDQRDEYILNHIPWFGRARTEEFKDLFEILRENAVLSQEFMVMLVLATLIASFGLFANSSPVIIGAMILAPLMSPIISIAMGVVRQDLKLLIPSIKTLATGTLGALFFGFLLTLIIPLKNITPEIQARLSPNLLDLMVAIVSGVAAAYANAKEKIAKSLAGVAIAVALVPPLAVSGIGIGWGDFHVFSGAFLLYFTNLAGIILAAGISFLILGFAPFHRAKKGLIYISIIVLILCVPLSFSFYKVAQETKLRQNIEGLSNDKISIINTNIILSRKNTYISLKLISHHIVTIEEIDKIKKEIEFLFRAPITLEIETALIR